MYTNTLIILIALLLTVVLLNHNDKIIIELLEEDMMSYCINNQIEEDIYDVQPSSYQ